MKSEQSGSIRSVVGVKTRTMVKFPTGQNREQVQERGFCLQGDCPCYRGRDNHSYQTQSTHREGSMLHAYISHSILCELPVFEARCKDQATEGHESTVTAQ